MAVDLALANGGRYITVTLERTLVAYTQQQQGREGVGGGSERAERLRLLQQEDKGEAPGLVLQLVLSCLANLSAIGGGACVVAHGGVQLMLRAAVRDETLRRYALAGLLNVCAHPQCAELIRSSAVPPLLRKLAKVHGNDKGVVPPIESQQAASILRTIEEKPPPAADID